MPNRRVTVGFATLFSVALGAAWRLFSGMHTPPRADGLEEIREASPLATKDLGHDASAFAPVPGPKLPQPPTTGLDAESQKIVQEIYGLFATGNFTGALQKCDDILQGAGLHPPLHAWILEQMPALLISAGWSSLKLGDCETAKVHLKRAASLTRSVEGTKGLAICSFKQKNLVEAEEQFHAYFELDENDLTMQVLYADLMESESRYDEAVLILEKLNAALTSAPSGGDGSIQKEVVQQRLTNMRGRAKAGLDQRSESTHHFRLSFRSGEHEELVSWVMTTLEIALDRYVEDYGFEFPPTQVEVLLYPSQDFSSVMVGSPSWAEGLFDGRIRIPVRASALKNAYDGDPDLVIVLRHELVHALFAVLTGGRALPSWFDEGVAQRLSCPREGCDPFTFPPTPGEFLTELTFQTPFTSFNSTMAGRAYQQGLYLVRNLEEMKGETALREIIARLKGAGDLSSDSILKASGLTFRDLHRTASYRWQQRWIPR